MASWLAFADSWHLVSTLLVTIGLQITCFLISYALQFDKITDLAGTANFVLLAWLGWSSTEGTPTTRQTVAIALVTTWGVRLGGFLLKRVLHRGHDARFDEMRQHFARFLGFWVFQIFWVWIVSLPVTILLANPTTDNTDTTALDVVGWVLWGIGFLLESTADQQKFTHHKSGSHELPCMRGAFSLCRHPNYFGEMTCWVGMLLACASGLEGAQFIAVLSPLFTIVILLFLSGVNLAEARYDKKYGANQEFVDYKGRTSCLIPMPSSLWLCLPATFKRLCCFEFRQYSASSRAQQPLQYDAKPATQV